MKKIFLLFVMSIFFFKLSAAYAVNDSPLQPVAAEDSQENGNSLEPAFNEEPSAAQEEVQEAVPSVVKAASSPVPLVNGKPLKTKEELADINIKTLQRQVSNLERELSGVEQSLRFQDEKIRSLDRKIDDLKRLR